MKKTTPKTKDGQTIKSMHLFPALLFTLILFSHGCSSKDPQTALLQNLGNGICHDTVSGLMWQSEQSKLIKTAEEAQLYVENLNLGGHTDWRLPTHHELYDLIYLFDLHLNGACTFDRDGKYWSREREGREMVGSWEISATQCDPARQYFRGSQGRVRAVRP